MGRKRVADEKRPTTTTRLYSDSVKIFKILAEIQDISMIEYLDILARRVAKEEGPRLMAEMARMTGEMAKLTGAEGDKKKGKSD